MRSVVFASRLALGAIQQEYCPGKFRYTSIVGALLDSNKPTQRDLFVVSFVTCTAVLQTAVYKKCVPRLCQEKRVRIIPSFLVGTSSPFGQSVQVGALAWFCLTERSLHTEDKSLLHPPSAVPVSLIFICTEQG